MSRRSGSSPIYGDGAAERVAYGVRLGSSEDAVTSAVTSILCSAETLLAHNFYERKSFDFAAKNGESIIVAAAEQCFVPCDVDPLSGDWEIESEPGKEPIDPWARMCTHLNKNRPPENLEEKEEERQPLKTAAHWKASRPGLLTGDFTAQATMPSPGTTTAAARMRNAAFQGLMTKRLSMRPTGPGDSETDGVALMSGTRSAPPTRVQQHHGHGKGRQRGEHRDQRVIPLAQHTQAVDPEEERWRQKLHAAEVARTELVAQQAAKKIEEEQEKRRREQELERIAAAGPATFDSYGNVIYIHAPAVADLPTVQEEMRYGVVAEPTDEPLATAPSVAGSSVRQAVHPRAHRDREPAQPRGTRDDVSSRGDLPQLAQLASLDHYQRVDGFTKLRSQQPPLLDTMQLRPGVVLQSNGTRKMGPSMRKMNEAKGGPMSFAEYREFCMQERGDDGPPRQSAFPRRKSLGLAATEPLSAWREPSEPAEQLSPSSIVSPSGTLASRPSPGKGLSGMPTIAEVLRPTQHTAPGPISPGTPQQAPAPKAQAACPSPARRSASSGGTSRQRHGAGRAMRASASFSGSLREEKPSRPATAAGASRTRGGSLVSRSLSVPSGASPHGRARPYSRG